METPHIIRINKIDRDYDNLLRLIEEGDPASILSEENLSKGFNDLMNHGLIILEEGKVHITDLGKEAKMEGVKTVMSREKINTATMEARAMTPLPNELLKPGRRQFWILILIFLWIFTLFASIQLVSQ